MALFSLNFRNHSNQAFLITIMPKLAEIAHQARFPECGRGVPHFSRLLREVGLSQAAQISSRFRVQTEACRNSSYLN
jgi:hypothetical protein